MYMLHVKSVNRCYTISRALCCYPLFAVRVSCLLSIIHSQHLTDAAERWHEMWRLQSVFPNLSFPHGWRNVVRVRKLSTHPSLSGIMRTYRLCKYTKYISTFMPVTWKWMKEWEYKYVFCVCVYISVWIAVRSQIYYKIFFIFASTPYTQSQRGRFRHPSNLWPRPRDLQSIHMRSNSPTTTCWEIEFLFIRIISPFRSGGGGGGVDSLVAFSVVPGWTMVDLAVELGPGSAVWPVLNRLYETVLATMWRVLRECGAAGRVMFFHMSEYDEGPPEQPPVYTAIADGCGPRALMYSKLSAMAKLCTARELIIYINVLDEIVVKRSFNLHKLNIEPREKESERANAVTVSIQPTSGQKLFVLCVDAFRSRMRIRWTPEFGRGGSYTYTIARSHLRCPQILERLGFHILFWLVSDGLHWLLSAKFFTQTYSI